MALGLLVGCTQGGHVPPDTKEPVLEAVGEANDQPVGNQPESDQPMADAGVADVESLQAILQNSSTREFMSEFSLDTTEMTSRHVFVPGFSADGSAVAVEVSVDSSGLDNFTLAPAELLAPVNPFTEILFLASDMPQWEYAPGVQESTYTGTNGQTTAILTVDAGGLLRALEFTSPDYVYHQRFYYEGEFDDVKPREFVERVNADREADGLDYVFGFTEDGFQSWEVTSY